MKILVFAGTSEGRALAEFLSQNGLPADVCVATEYGAASLPPLPGISIHTGRLDRSQMQCRMQAQTIVIDATHPYAAEVTQNIREACENAGSEYLRLLRPATAQDTHMIAVPDVHAAAAYLNQVTGSALLTTGSKELEAFTAVNRFAERLYPRVLPSVEVLQKCMALGFSASHILAMQGPFSHALNLALLQQTTAKFLVTKDTGDAGGFFEKVSAARAYGATVLVIRRPTEEQGLSFAQITELLKRRFALEPLEKPKFPLFVSLQGRKAVVVGAGPIGVRRIQALCRFGARVTVISPTCAAALPSQAVWEKREYRSGDTQGAFLAVAATPDRSVNRQIARECQEQQILCSVADCAEESTFYFPAICEGGGLIAGLVSSGTEHARTARMAEAIRRTMQEGAQYENH